MFRIIAGMLAFAATMPAFATTSITTRLVVAGGTATTASIVPGGAVTLEVRIDAPAVSAVGTVFRLSQTAPAASGYFSIVGRSQAGSPFNDPSGGAPDAVVLGGPGNVLAPTSGLDLGNNAPGLAGIAPASNILISTITLSSSPLTPPGTYRIQPAAGLSFATEVTTIASGADSAMSDAWLDIVVAPITVHVVTGGSGSGTVASTPAGISCQPLCDATFDGAQSVVLSATPADAGSLFSGWLGACTGTGACTVGIPGVNNVTAVFAPNSVFSLRLDADENGAYSPLTDGLLLLRYLFGATGTALTDGALGAGSSLTPAQVLQHLDDLRPLLDIDGNGAADALTDGLMLVRYLSGLRGAALIAGAIGPGATRTTAGPIELQIQSLLPP